MVDNPAARVKPPDADELQWRAALQLAGGPENPDRLWPVQAKGFKDLIARKNAQVCESWIISSKWKRFKATFLGSREWTMDNKKGKNRGSWPPFERPRTQFNGQTTGHFDHAKPFGDASG